jgi:hypothetical protein
MSNTANPRVKVPAMDLVPTPVGTARMTWYPAHGPGARRGSARPRYGHRSGGSGPAGNRRRRRASTVWSWFQALR